MDFEDKWVSALGAPNLLNVPSAAWNSLERYMTFGNSAVRSDGRFRATRSGDDIEVTGTVQHGLNTSKDYPDGQEAFDFDEGGTGAPQARVLERAGTAAPFGMSYRRLQDVAAQLRREPNGTLVLRRSTWGAMR